MKLHQLQKSKGIKNKQPRRGRGNATGTGNYSGRGLKGQKSRSGYSMKPFFEGGQTSIVKRLPKARGFKRYYKLVKNVTIINLGTLDADTRISDAMEITKALLKDLGYTKKVTDFVKILGNGDYTKHLIFTDIDAFSASAKSKIENPGAIHSASKKASKVEKTIKNEESGEKSGNIEEKNIEDEEVRKSDSMKLIETKIESSKKPAIKTKEKKPVTKKLIEKKAPTTKKSVVKKSTITKTK